MMLAADDRARFLPLDAGGLAGPALHAVGDVFLDAVGRHAAVEGQHLHGRAFEDRQDVDRDHASPEDEHADEGDTQDTKTVTAYGLLSEARISPFMDDPSPFRLVSKPWSSL